jgi:putative spermidine/putrescine transport system substrate-binding protein
MIRLSTMISAAAATAVAALLAAAPARAESQSITVESWGVTWDMGLRTIADNFTKATGIQVVAIPQASSTEGLVKLQAMEANPTIDVWFTTSSVAARAEQDHKLFLPIDKSKLTNAPDLIKGAEEEYWVAAYYYPLSIVYRPDRVYTPITGWKDLWDGKFKGQIAAPSIEMYQARLLLVSTLINGGSIDNIDPGLKGLQALAPNVATWYQSDSDGRKALSLGEASVLVAPPALAKAVADDGVKVKIVSPNPTPVMFDVMMLVNTPKHDAAGKFIDYVLSPESQAIIAKGQNVGPVNVKAEPPADVVAAMPKPADQVTFDEGKINANIAAWTDRFTSQVVH